MKFFDWILGRNMPMEPWHLQRLNWLVTEYQLDGELAESATNWLSVGDTAEVLDQMVKEQGLIVFGYADQQCTQYQYISFELLVGELVIILANDAQALFAPLAQQYRKLSTSRVHDNRANELLGTNDLLWPEEIIQHKCDLLMIRHDADSIFLIRQDK